MHWFLRTLLLLPHACFWTSQTEIQRPFLLLVVLILNLLLFFRICTQIWTLHSMVIDLLFVCSATVTVHVQLSRDHRSQYTTSAYSLSGTYSPWVFETVYLVIFPEMSTLQLVCKKQRVLQMQGFSNLSYRLNCPRVNIFTKGWWLSFIFWDYNN